MAGTELDLSSLAPKAVPSHLWCIYSLNIGKWGKGNFFFQTVYIMNGLWLCLVRKRGDTFKDLFSKAAHRKDGVNYGWRLVEGQE